MKGRISREKAETWASWFRCLGEPSRVLILNHLATAGRPLSVGELVDALDIGQSTVSHHLKILEETRFVFAARIGTSSLFRVNEACLDCFPSAAEVVMGRGTAYGPSEVEGRRRPGRHGSRRRAVPA